ncbi:uncharacterized protein LOC127705457 [Mytilus californianus]|uniref:uncharacterized protein LOC127705457 n=1 Tax=Mytilus californianus TaxID=6549 RepID=UPI002245EC6E|nr:uncharacterized protein LOC127705457 [Mytilus californianus]XP_052065742.1 uncharacterized protein LOC127705457 [Mytilus californianus]
MDDLTFVDRLKRAVNTDDADELLRLCCDSSKRKEILNFKDDAGHCLLHRVAGSGTVDLMRTLMDMGAEDNEDDCIEFEKTCLQTACSHGNTEVVKYFLQTDEGLEDEASKIEYNDCYELFYFAAKSGNIETIKNLQKKSQLDINQVFSNGSTALLMLVKDNDSKGVEILCKCGADVNIGTIGKTKNRTGLKAIHTASRGFKNCAEMIQILLKYGANVNEPLIRNNLNQQPLFMALSMGNEGNARVLLEHGADISYKGETLEGTIGCFCLAIKKCPSLVLDFIKRGANLYETHQKSSVLMIALDSNAGSESIEALVEAGANLNFGRDGKNVIQCCTHYDQLKSFLNAGISVQDIECNYKVPTLGLALHTLLSNNIYTFGRSGLEIESQELELIKNDVADLISNGANPDLSTQELEIPLITATKNRLQGVFEMLIAVGANIHQLGKDGNSAVHVCCIESNWKFLEILITADTDLNKANAKGDYPLELAIKGNPDLYSEVRRFSKTNVNNTSVLEDIITKMLNKGANPNLTKGGKNSPLILAIMERLDKIVEVLLHAGADVSHIGKNKTTAFASCLRNGLKKTNTLRILIENGLPLNQPNSAGKYPLEFLIHKRCDCTLISLMLSNGADPNIIAKENPVLTRTVKLKLYDVCIDLLDAGADIGVKDEDGCTAFDIFTRQLKEQNDFRRYNIQGSARELLKRFVLAGIDVNQQTVSGTYPIFLAVSSGAEYVIKVMLDKGADVNVVNEYGNTPLVEAIFHYLDDIVQQLLHSGANVNQICKEKTQLRTDNINRTGYTASHHRVLKSMEDMEDTSNHKFKSCILTKIIKSRQMILKKKRDFVGLLLEFGADPNFEKSGHDSCLMHAVQQGDPVLVKTLLNAKADINHIGNKGYTALHIYFLNSMHRSEKALCRKLLERSVILEFEEDDSSILQTLLEYGAPTNVSCTDGDLPIHIAVSNCTTYNAFESNVDDIISMIDLTKDLNVPDKKKSTPFLDIIKFCNLDVLKKMVELGADVKSKGTNGNTALHVVVEKKKFSKDIVSFLLQNGADINAMNDPKETPLILCMKRGSNYATVDNISFLLENGANANSCADGSNSALLEAISFESFHVASALIDHQANLKHIGENGNTVLHALFSKENKREIQPRTYFDNYALYDSNDGTTYAGFTSFDKPIVKRYAVSIKSDGHEERVEKQICEVLEIAVELVDAGACLNIVNKDGHTPLYCLIKEKDTTTIESVLPYLIEKGSDPNLGYDLPLIASVYLNQTTTTKMLLEHGADVNRTNSLGNTALTTTLNDYCHPKTGYKKEIIDILLKSGASVTLTDGNGKQPLLLLINSVTQRADFYHEYSDYDKEVSQTVLKLIGKGADPNAIEVDEDSALILAVQYKLLTIVRILLESGADINHLGKNGQNVLHCYFRYNGIIQFYDNRGSKSLEILELLLSKHLRVNLQDNDGATPLHLSIKNQNIEGVKKLLSAESDILLQGKDGLNALELCLTLRADRDKCLQILDALTDHQLLDRNVDVFFRKFWEYIKSNEFQGDMKNLDSVTCKILTTGEDVNVNFAKEMDDSPLIYFCRLGCLQSLKMLLVHNADVNHVGNMGMTALHHIISLKNYEHAVPLFDCLLAASPRLDISDSFDETVLKSAFKILCGMGTSEWNYYDASLRVRRHNYVSTYIQKMLKAGATPDPNDLNDALRVFAMRNDFRGLECLIRHGGDYRKTDENGKSILHLCWLESLDGALEFLQFFVDTGCLMNNIESVKNSIMLSLLSGDTHANGITERDDKIKDIVSFLIKNGACRGKNKDGNGPLHIAAKNGYLATIEVLLQFGKDSVFDHNEAGDTAIHVCLKNPKVNVCDIIETMLENQTSNQLCQNLHGESLLYLATIVWRRQLIDISWKKQLIDVSTITSQLVATLLRNGVNPNDHTQDQIPLLSALEARDIQTSTLLLEAGANINATNYEGISGLHTIFGLNSKKENDLCLAQLLLEHGINVNLVDKDGRSGLFFLVIKHQQNYHSYCHSDGNSFEDVFNVLLKHGADLNICDNLNETALSSYINSETVLDIANVLLKSGADPKLGYCLQNYIQNYRNIDSWISFIHSLLQKGADPNKRKANGSNLIDCVWYQDSRLVEEIINYGADVNFADDMKKTALHYACAKGQLEDRYEMASLLVKCGSNLNAVSTTGERPLDVLVQHMINDIKGLQIKEEKEEQYGFITVDVSLLNILVCGGADLGPVSLESIDPKTKDLSAREMQLQSQIINRPVLFNLITNGLFKTAEYLIRSGWDVKKEEWFDAFDVSKRTPENVEIKYRVYKRHDIETKKAEFQSFLEKIDRGPKSLTDICRKAIRHQLLMVSNGSEIETKISALPLPAKIKRFICLKEFMNDDEIIQIERMESSRVNHAQYDSDGFYDDYYNDYCYDSSDSD